MGVIIDREANDLCGIATRAGVLQGKYSRNQFDLCAQRLLSMSDVRQDREIALRTAVHDDTQCGGQGYVRCNCAGSGDV